MASPPVASDEQSRRNMFIPFGRGNHARNHINNILPPSLAKFRNKAEISYYIKATIHRPAFRPGHRAQVSFQFRPKEPPRPPRSSEPLSIRRSISFRPPGTAPSLVLSVKILSRLRQPSIWTSNRPASGSSPFRFLDLPFELRREIIRYIISINRTTPKPPDRIRTGFEIEPHDFTISAAGLTSHFIRSFSLMYVNKQVRQEVLSIVFHGATVCLYVDIPRYDIFSEVAAAAPRIIHILDAYPLLGDLAREVTVVIHPEPFNIPAKFVRTDRFFMLICTFAALGALVVLTRWIQRTAPFSWKRHAELQALVDKVVREFKGISYMKIVVHLDGLDLQDLKIILGLFQTPRCTITLEELWEYLEGWAHRYAWRDGETHLVRQSAMRNYEISYESLVRNAAEKSGHKLILTVCPS